MAYDGAEFHGWQVQPGLATVQGTLAECLKRLTGEDVLPQGSGRTDAGVHALAQVASVRLESPIPERNMVSALNDILPSVDSGQLGRGDGGRFPRAALGEGQDLSLPHLSVAISARRFWRGMSYHDPYPMNEEAVHARLGSRGRHA